MRNLQKVDGLCRKSTKAIKLKLPRTPSVSEILESTKKVMSSPGFSHTKAGQAFLAYVAKEAIDNPGSNDNERKNMADQGWAFSRFHFSKARGLMCNGEEIHLQPKVKRLLELLLQSEGEIVSKDEIDQKVWPETKISDNSIARCIMQLRKAFESQGEKNIIKTEYGAGVRLTVTITETNGYLDYQECSLRSSNELLRTALEVASKRTQKEMNRAQAILKFTNQQHPEFVPAWNMSADGFVIQASRGYLRPPQAARLIQDATSKVLSLSKNEPSALATRGWSLAILENDHDAGREMINLSLDIEPNAWLSLYYRAWIFAQAGDIESALKDINRALTLSPLERFLLGLKPWLELCEGQIEQSRLSVTQALVLRSDVDILFLSLSVAACESGDFGEAVAYAEEAVRISGNDPFVFSFLAYAFARAGSKTETKKILKRFYEGNGFITPTFLAGIKFALGDTDGARRALEFAKKSVVLGIPWPGATRA